MPEARFLKIIIIALLLLNAGTLGYLWLNHGGPARPFRHDGPPGPGGEGGRRGNTATFLREALTLTDVQEATYKTLRDRHHEMMMNIRSEMKEDKRALYALMKPGDTSVMRSEAQRWVDSLAAKQRRIEIITFDHFREVRALCTPQQQKKFDEVIGEALEQMR